MSSPTYLSLLRHSITRRTIWSIKKTPPNRTHHGRGLECGTWWGWIHFLPSSHLSTVQQPASRRHRLMANVRARVLPTNRKCRMPRRNSGNGTPKKDNEKYPVKATNAASRCCLLTCWWCQWVVVLFPASSVGAARLFFSRDDDGGSVLSCTAHPAQRRSE